MDRISVTLIRLIFFAILAVLVGMAVFRMFASGLPFSKSVAAGSGNYETASDGTISPDLVIPGGRSIGVKMDVEDVLVVGLEEIKTADGEETNPGLKAGLQIGDIILAIDGSEVHSASDVMAIVENTEKESVRLKIARKNEIRYLDVEPVKSAEDGKYRLGVWVKEKTAGIGTLTYYRPYDGTFGALGHGITDAETGSVLKVAEGQLLDAQVMSLKEGRKGQPGEIKGIFYEADKPLGELSKDHVEKFKIKIEKINKNDPDSVKNMVIRVTDKDLIEKSGGIIQGMSGSPILQNGKIIGAVTHVFVNDPRRGYGIFISNMLRMSE